MNFIVSPQCADYLEIDAEGKEEVDAFLCSHVHGVPAGKVRCGEAEQRDVDPVLPKGRTWNADDMEPYYLITRNFCAYVFAPWNRKKYVPAARCTVGYCTV